jgi:antibiotic biosynthesis monooxygenase (ABM) superfamily enzyme
LTRPDPGPSLPSARKAPSIHVQAAITFLAIFPLVAIGITVMAPFTVGWDPLLRVFVLTLVVVPLSVYLVVPWLMSIYDRYLAPRR